MIEWVGWEDGKNRLDNGKREREKDSEGGNTKGGEKKKRK